MSRQLQFRRGTKTENDNFTGATGEITYDETSKKLRIHDGSTRGGLALARDGDVVHNSGNETVNGQKTFSSTIVASNTTGVQLNGIKIVSGEASYKDIVGTDTAGSRIGGVRFQHLDNDNRLVSVFVSDTTNTNQGGINITTKPDGSVTTVTRTAYSSSNLNTSSNEIPTIGWVNTANVSNVVHKTDTETIGGNKKFTSVIDIHNGGIDLVNTSVTKGTVPTDGTKYWGIRANDSTDSSTWANTRLGTLEWALTTDNKVTGTFNAIKNAAGVTNSARLSVVYDTASGAARAYAPNMSISDTGEEIVTAQRLRDLLKDTYQTMSHMRTFDTLFAGPIGSGNITLAAPYTNYAYILVAGGNDNQNARHTLLIPSYCITQCRQYGRPWLLWHNGSGNYWYLGANSTETSFISPEENSVINGIWGISF